MKIGILGAGRVAQAFADKAIAAGHQVKFSNSRGPDSLGALLARYGDAATAVTPAEAARSALVVLAVPFPKVAQALAGLPAWQGQILLDTTNDFDPEAWAAGATSSELVARMAPGARVVKAINSSFMSNFAQNPVHERMRRVLFISGDDQDAKNQVADLFEGFGFAPVDLGTLASGGRIQGMGAPVAGHDFFVPWPAPRSFPFSGL